MSSCRITIRRTSRPSACLSPKPRPARSVWKPCSPRDCGWCTAAGCRLGKLLKAMSTRPAELLGLQAGTLKPGSPADVIVVDIDMPWVLDPAELKSKCKNTPFDEARLQGRVLRTIVAGRTVFQYASSVMEHRPVPAIAALAFGYLLGSIPFGLIFTRLAGTQDIRAIGSGNIGATNVLRTGRKGLAAATLLADMLKGTVAVLAHALVVRPRLPGCSRGARRVSRPPFSGLAQVQGRQGRRDLSRRAARRVVARPRSSSARSGSRSQPRPAIPRSSSHRSACTAIPIYFWIGRPTRRPCSPFLVLRRADYRHASRQYRAPDAGH